MHFDTYLESGKKKVFAGALDWPGWSRWGKTEAESLQALLAYGLRYARVLDGTELNFVAPDDVGRFKVVEKLEGNSTTDFGAPAIPPTGDARPFAVADLRWHQILLAACWETFDEAVATAEGQSLRKGPRGGGRDQEKIVRHVVAAEHATSDGWGGRPRR